MGHNPAWEKVFRERAMIASSKKAKPSSPHAPADEVATIGTQPFVILPKAISVNGMYPGKGRRFKSMEYKAWIKAALPIMRTLKSPTLPAKYHYTILGKLRSTADGENVSKGILDLAVEAGVIPDDCVKYIVGGSWSYEPVEGAEGVRFEFLPVGQP